MCVQPLGYYVATRPISWFDDVVHVNCSANNHEPFVKPWRSKNNGLNSAALVRSVYAS